MKFIKVFYVIALSLLLSIAAYAQNITTDVVVIGAGASGTSAALSSLTNGAKTVLIEKTAFPAGAGTFAGGMFAADSAQQKLEGKVVDKKWYFDQYMTASNYHANARLVNNIINNSGKTVDFLNANGAKFGLVDGGTGGQYWHIFDPATLHGYQNGGGAKNIGYLHETFVKKGGVLMFNTKGVNLVKDAKGNISGVVAENEDGEMITINAKAVIIATGGMGANKEMMEKYLRIPNPPLSPIAAAQGEGVKMALAAGAKEGHVVAEYFSVNPRFTGNPGVYTGGATLRAFGKTPFLRVNNEGKRYFREDRASDFAAGANALMEQPDYQGWIVFNEKYAKQIEEKGFSSIQNVYGRWRDSNLEFYEFNHKLNMKEVARANEQQKDLFEVIDGAIKSGAMVKANSIKELAKLMKVDPATLEAEIKRYNALGHAKNDEDFYNQPEFMYPLDEGPFYALNIHARNLGGLGGIVVNENLEVIKPDYKVIPGLYAVGNDVTGMYGNSYVMFEGATLGFAYTSGMIAGQNAAKLVKGK